MDDLVLCVLRGGLTRGEITFVEMGRGDRVVLQRGSFHEAVSPVFAQAIEELTGRIVETTLHSTDEEDDVSTLVFLLEPPEVAALHETEEGWPANASRCEGRLPTCGSRHGRSASNTRRCATGTKATKSALSRRSPSAAPLRYSRHPRQAALPSHGRSSSFRTC